MKTPLTSLTLVALILTALSPAVQAVEPVANTTGAGGIGNGCTLIQGGPLPVNPLSEVRLTAVLTLADNGVIAAKL